MLQSNSVTLPSEGRSTVLSAQRIATLLCFFSLGFATAAWAPLIPFAQQRMNFNHAEFGALLLCEGICKKKPIRLFKPSSRQYLATLKK